MLFKYCIVSHTANSIEWWEIVDRTRGVFRILSKISFKELSRVGYFWKNVPSWTCDWVLNTPPDIFCNVVINALMLMFVTISEELTWSIIMPYINVVSTFVPGMLFFQWKSTSIFFPVVLYLNWSKVLKCHVHLPTVVWPYFCYILMEVTC